MYNKIDNGIQIYSYFIHIGIAIVVLYQYCNDLLVLNLPTWYYTYSNFL